MRSSTSPPAASNARAVARTYSGAIHSSCSLEVMNTGTPPSGATSRLRSLRTDQRPREQRDARVRARPRGEEVGDHAGSLREPRQHDAVGLGVGGQQLRDRRLARVQGVLEPRLVGLGRVEVAPGVPLAPGGGREHVVDVVGAEARDQMLEHVVRILLAPMEQHGGRAGLLGGRPGEHPVVFEVGVLGAQLCTVSIVSMGSSCAISGRRSSQCGGMHMWVPSSSAASSIRKPCSVP